jgi:hypothetical protein
MKQSSDMLLTAKILLTIATLGYSAIPAKFDSDETHLRNQSWDPHARYHVMWQVSSYVYLAILALYLIWGMGDSWSLWLAVLFGVVAYGGFWTAFFTRSTYDTSVVSKVNPVPEFNLGFGKFDANLTLFSFFCAVLAIAAVLLAL